MELQWPLIIFTTMVCLSAGTLSFTSALALMNKGEKAQMPGIVVAFVAIVVGGLASAMHLQTPMNYFGQFGNPTSGINQELVCVALAAIAMIIYFVQLRGGKAPTRWVPVVSIIVSVLLVIVMSHSYMMPAIPAWNTLLLPVYYLAGAAALGSVCVGIIAAASGCDEATLRTVGLWALICVAVALLATIAYCVFIASLSGDAFYEVFHTDVTTVPPLDPASMGERMMSGDMALLFWGGVIACAVVALAFAAVAWKKPQTALFAGAIVFLVASGIAFRALLYVAGATLMTY